MSYKQQLVCSIFIYNKENIVAWAISFNFHRPKQVLSGRARQATRRFEPRTHGKLSDGVGFALPGHTSNLNCGIFILVSLRFTDALFAVDAYVAGVLSDFSEKADLDDVSIKDNYYITNPTT